MCMYVENGKNEQTNTSSIEGLAYIHTYESGFENRFEIRQTGIV